VRLMRRSRLIQYLDQPEIDLKINELAEPYVVVRLKSEPSWSQG
jgi:hypothetical protein